MIPKSCFLILFKTDSVYFRNKNLFCLFYMPLRGGEKWWVMENFCNYGQVLKWGGFFCLLVTFSLGKGIQSSIIGVKTKNRFNSNHNRFGDYTWSLLKSSLQSQYVSGNFTHRFLALNGFLLKLHPNNFTRRFLSLNIQILHIVSPFTGLDFC